jgi:hypothetical protein
MPDLHILPPPTTKNVLNLRWQQVQSTCCAAKHLNLAIKHSAHASTLNLSQQLNSVRLPAQRESETWWKANLSKLIGVCLHAAKINLTENSNSRRNLSKKCSRKFKKIAETAESGSITDLRTQSGRRLPHYNSWLRRIVFISDVESDWFENDPTIELPKANWSVSVKQLSLNMLRATTGWRRESTPKPTHFLTQLGNSHTATELPCTGCS